MQNRIYKECLHYFDKEHPNANKLYSTFGHLCIWFRQYVCQKFEMPYIEMFITTRCNLRCEKCSNLIPYLPHRQNYSFDEIKKTIQALLSKTDRLYRLKIHGGEAFLNPDLEYIIGFLDKQKKIKSIRLTTNGTIIPNEKLLAVLKSSKVVVQISDYNLPDSKINKLIALFKSYSIRFTYLKGQKWKDMGEFERRETNRFKDCSMKRCVSLLNNRIYICSRAAIMEELNIIPDEGISLSTPKRQFKKNFFDMYKNENNACNYCDGDTLYAPDIKAGAQKSL